MRSGVMQDEAVRRWEVTGDTKQRPGQLTGPLANVGAAILEITP
ncbi:hypothetical protein [Sphingobacterium sp. InxBP1]|nr:hypothetical protein [Sphingobacterium sp. InxBP1]